MFDTIDGSSQKRPVAQFICYSQQQLKEMQGVDNTWPKMSRKELGERWKALPFDEKKRFADMAKASALEHIKLVPHALKSEKLLYIDCVCSSSTSTSATTRFIPRHHDWGDAQIRETLWCIRMKQNFSTDAVEFDCSKDQSYIDDDEMGAHHVNNQQKA